MGRSGALSAARAARATFAGTAGRAVWSPVDLSGWIRRCLEREADQRRLFPWIAVAFGLGIVLFFQADGRPSAWAPAFGAMLFAALSWRCGHRPLLLALCVGLTALFAGFGAALIRTAWVEAPILAQTTIGKVEGFVESVEERQKGGRIVLRIAALEKVENPPQRVRVSLRDLAGIAPGDYVRASARLLPPPEAARPGGYDFARDAFYKGIGAVGSIAGKPAVIVPAPRAADLDLRLAAAIDRARNSLTTRIAGSIGGQPGAVAAALITGKRGLIDESTNDILRAAGIYHVVSISGLHMVLAAGTFFWIARAILAAIPGLALVWPLKKIAALVGMAGATAYCIFSGSEVATERSLLMILVMQGAIIFDRPALSMRNLAISALIVLAREPETLLGPSLQMSYAAVAGLIALAELYRRRAPEEGPSGGLARVSAWIAAACIGVVATTLVASLATAPFGTYHFQNVQPYGIIGNAATLPLISLAVMPAAVLGVVAYPFGLDGRVWWLMGRAVEGVLELSRWVGGFEGAVVIVPAFGLGALGCLTAALLVVTLCCSALRWLSVVPAVAGILLAVSTARPDIYVARDGTSAAVRGGDGRLVLIGRFSDFTAEQWLRADGDARKAPAARSASPCDPRGCVARLPNGEAVALTLDRRAFAEDCRRAAIVVSRLQAPPGCAARLVLDRGFLARSGAAAVRVRDGGFAVETARQPNEAKPWLAAPAIRSQTQTAAAAPTAPEPDPPAAAEGDDPLP